MLSAPPYAGSRSDGRFNVDAKTRANYLRQAACSEELAGQIERLCASGCAADGLPKLARHRVQLLDELRAADQRLSCLDSVIADITASSRVSAPRTRPANEGPTR